MSDAYQCDRCGEYNAGSGIPTRYGTLTGASFAGGNYDWVVEAELCDSCREELDELVENYMGDGADD